MAIDMSTKESANPAVRQLTVSSSHAPTPHHAALEVVEGVHEGVSMPLVKSVYSIGCKPSADIMLGDPGVAPEHGIVRLYGSAIVVEASGGEIGLGKRHRIPHGHGCRTTLPVQLKLGTAVLRIARDRSDGGWRRGRTAFRFAAIAGIGFAVLIPLSGLDTGAAIGRLSSSVLPGNGAAPFQLAQATPNSPGRVVTTAPNGVPATTGIDPDTVADALAAQLKDAGFADLALKMEGVRVVVSGVISHEQSGAWSDVQRWFDLTYGARYILASAVEARAPNGPPKFDLQAISYSATPYVITADGQRRYPGAVLDKGWIIKDIGAGRLTLIKDGKELALNF
jgi:Inner membrane component of T3SS, periplasmic domain/Inner membrane component of T3SS, cytoplasmic domain